MLFTDNLSLYHFPVIVHVSTTMAWVMQNINCRIKKAWNHRWLTNTSLEEHIHVLQTTKVSISLSGITQINSSHAKKHSKGLFHR